ncbi:MAG: SsrA-binding protein SmpB [Oligoflexia bacterium]|nr:SsrA-binding protein SmpB [Oligoflexia bacterium]
MGIKIISQNKKALHDYFVIESYEAGISLMGSEVKSLRLGHVQFKDAFVTFKGKELFLVNCHINPYAASSYNNHDPERDRKLLLHRSEIDKIIPQLREMGLTMVPLKMYFKEGRAKVEVAIVKGKKAYDKRESIKKRDVSKQLDQLKRRDR